VRKLIGWGLLVGLAVIVIAMSTGNDKKTDDASAASADSSQISVVVSNSSCVMTGIADAYTGEGKVAFMFELRNTGSSGTVNVTPVRYYDDGERNASAMDMLVDVEVPGHTSERYSSPQYKYKAHEHEIVGCGLKLDGGAEIEIPAQHI